MPVDPRLKAQIDLILSSHRDAAAFPGNWEEVGDVEYLYRKNTILVRDQDAGPVTEVLTSFLASRGDGDAPVGKEPYGTEGEPPGAGAGPSEAPEDPFSRQRVVAGVLRFTVPSVPAVLREIDDQLGAGVATPDTMLYVSPHACPATEPVEVPPGTVTPVPPPGLSAQCCRPGHGIPRPGCDGDGVFVSIVDTGLIPDAATGHPWLAGVRGRREDPYEPGSTVDLRAYAGHGTFVAGCLRCAAPKASVFVERAFDIAGADYESNLARSLEDALRRSPDILLFTFTTTSRHDRPLLTFLHLYERHIRHLKGLLVVAPAGNDGKRRRNWPAAFDWVVSVGALAASWGDRARFSNFGSWVDVYAPGEDLVNAFPSGTYVCKEPPIGERREFQGMAEWSGTSFSTPIVAGLIAARMSATGETGQQAADSLLRLAHSQAIPGTGAVLYPGQACCEPGHRRQGAGQAGIPCGCNAPTPACG
jgi:hypothetical protein